MKLWVHKANQVLSAIGGWLMLAMVLLLIADVVFRSFGRPLLLMAELSVFVMMIVIYLGFSRCEEQHEHVRLEFLVNNLRPNTRARLRKLVDLLAVLVVALLLGAVARNAWSSWRTGSAIAGTVDIPIWPTLIVMVFGMAVFLLQSLVNLLDSAESDSRTEEADATSD